jgi:hypothetical protein
MLEVAKGLIAIVGSGGLFLLDTIAQVTSGLPEWVNSFGLPVAMLFASIYGIVKLFQSLLAERNARIVDRDATIAMLREEAKAARLLHEELIKATKDQTFAFVALTEEIKTAIESK